MLSTSRRLASVVFDAFRAASHATASTSCCSHSPSSLLFTTTRSKHHILHPSRAAVRAGIQESIVPTAVQGILDKMKKSKGYTPGTRHRMIVDRNGLHKGGPLMPLTIGLKKSGGRNNQGKCTVRGRGGGHKRRLRLVDFQRGPEVWGKPSTVIRLEYDPNRTARVALVRYDDTSLGFDGYAYLLLAHGVKPGDRLESGPLAPQTVGNTLPLGRIPLGLEVHAIELMPGQGAQLVRAAGTYAEIVGRSDNEKYVLVRFPSGEVRRINAACQATIGRVSNPLHQFRILGKAGAARWLGRRPTVRGVAMNPPDHPHGGGRKGSSAMPSRSRTGVLSKGGFRTRRYDRNRLKWLVLSRHEARRKVRGY